MRWQEAVGERSYEAELHRLRGELAARAARHPDHQRNAELPAGHVRDRRGVVHDLVEREQAEVHRHHLDDRAHAAEGGSDAQEFILVVKKNQPPSLAQPPRPVAMEAQAWDFRPEAVDRPRITPTTLTGSFISAMARSVTANSGFLKR